MKDLVILGTDTDAGKTTVALMCLSRFADRFEYWKPVETGVSDSETIARLVPRATVHPRGVGLVAPVAPPLAARLEGTTIPVSTELGKLRPAPIAPRTLLIESFGNPFSPLTEVELQIDWIRTLDAESILVASSRLGAIGRTLSTLAALEAHGVRPLAVVLLGEPDPFAEEKVRQWRPTLTVVSLVPPPEWTADAIQQAASQQTGHLNELFLAYETRETRSPAAQKKADVEQILALDRSSVWHPYTPLMGVGAPLVCTGAQDEFLQLADGRRVIDGISSWWTIQHGHRFPPLMEALRNAAEAIDHVIFAGVTHPWACELAERMLASVPWPRGGRVFYSDNGSTAVEVALKLAYQYWCHAEQPNRRRFIGFEHGYHGDTFGAMAVSRDPLFFGRFEPLLFQADILPLDPNRVDEFLRLHAHETAAVILEPFVQGAGGMRMHSSETLRQIHQAARDHGVLFIADEVMTGGGRTGSLWAFEQAAIVPDLICAGKTLAGGILPLAATLIGPPIVDAFASPDRARTFFHGHSFTAHPLACAVACENWRRLESKEFLEAPLAFEIFWKSRLETLRSHPRVRDLRVRGSIVAIELDVDGGYLASVATALRETCLAHGVLLRPLGNVLYAMPPFRTSHESLHRIATAIESAIGNST